MIWTIRAVTSDISNFNSYQFLPTRSECNWTTSDIDQLVRSSWCVSTREARIETWNIQLLRELVYRPNWLIWWLLSGSLQTVHMKVNWIWRDFWVGSNERLRHELLRTLYLMTRWSVWSASDRLRMSGMYSIYSGLQDSTQQYEDENVENPWDRCWHASFNERSLAFKLLTILARLNLKWSWSVVNCDLKQLAFQFWTLRISYFSILIFQPFSLITKQFETDNNW